MKRWSALALLALAATVGAACSQSEPTATPTPTATLTPTSILTPVTTSTPTPTPTTSPGPTPTVPTSSTPTQAASAEAVVYGIDKCDKAIVPGSNGLVSIDTCVTTIASQSQGSLLRVNVTWTAHVGVPGARLQRRLEEREPNVVLEDDQGNQYSYVDLGGAAKGIAALDDGQPVEGWYLFPVPAVPLFALVDNDQGVRISGIELTTSS